MAARLVTSTALGALAVVVGWVAWSMLAPQQEPPALPPVQEQVAQAVPPVPTPPAPVEQAPRPAAAVARAAPSAPVRARLPLRDGLVMQHGMPTAVHALADDGSQAATPPAVALPAGVRTEDAVVNRAGTVALNRSADMPADVDASTANAPRQPAATHAP